MCVLHAALIFNVTEPLADGYNAIVNVGYDALSWYLDNLGEPSMIMFMTAGSRCEIASDITDAWLLV